jgi:hypothetical protein
LDTSDTDSNTSDNDSDLDLDLAYRDNNHQIEAFAATKKKVKKSYKKPSSTDFRSRSIGLPYGIEETSIHVPHALCIQM